MVAWLDECHRHGPPGDAVRIYADEDLFYAVVPGTDVNGVSVVIKYLVVLDDREQLIIVRGID